MKCSVHEKTSMCEVQGINSCPVFLMDLDLRPRVWPNEVGINPRNSMGCQLTPAHGAQPPRAHPALWGQQLWVLAALGRFGVPSAPQPISPECQHSPWSLQSPPCRTPGLCSPAWLQGGCKGKDANSDTHPSRSAPLKIGFGLGTCLCSCTLR